MNKTTYCLLAVLAATLVNTCLPDTANFCGTLILSLVLVPIASRLDREAHEREYHNED